MRSPETWFHRLATDYVLAQALYHLNRAGVLAALPGAPVELARRLRLKARPLAGLLDYVAAVDGLLAKDARGSFRLTPFGRRVSKRYGANLFDVRVGAYGPVWSSLDRVLRGEPARREGPRAAEGLSKLAHNFFPAVRRAIAAVRPSAVCELGASTRFPGSLGVDRDRRTGAQVVADVLKPGAWAGKLPERTLFYSVHFHEFLAAGKPALRRMLRGLPGHVLVLEQPRADTLYAHSNVLIHELIGKGRILSEKEWVALARSAGRRLVWSRPAGYLGYRAMLFR